MADYLLSDRAELVQHRGWARLNAACFSELGAKGFVEASTSAPAAVMNAVHEALRRLGARLTEMPMTPERIFDSTNQAILSADCWSQAFDEVAFSCDQ